MPYTRTTTINSAPGGDTVKQAVLDLDTDLTGAFTHLNTVQSDVDANQVVTDGHIAATAAHGATGAVVGTTNVQTLTNKTIDLTSNTLTGTLAQFNTAVSDADLLSTASAAATYAPVANGVTNGDSHDHSGGDGAQIAYSSLSGIPATCAPSSHTIGSHSDWPATVDMTEVGYLNGVTSAIQTQLNAKQDTLVSGTNIKTVNSTSLVGMGDVVVQPTLVSGTNIKTINTLSLLGAGDLSIPALTDGDKGNVTVSNSGATWTVESVAGNLDFLGTAARIRGDFSNATIANRTMFQTSTVNGNTIIRAIPGGSGGIAILQIGNSSDPANQSTFSFSIDASLTSLQSGTNGTGTYLPMAFYTGGVQRLNLATDGTFTSVSGAIGYGIGAGGTVTQATSKSTSVTLNKPCGQITMNNAALAAGATANFSFFNSLVAAADLLLVAPTYTSNGHNYRVDAVSAVGSSLIRVTNISGVSLSDALVINFAVIKGAIS